MASSGSFLKQVSAKEAWKSTSNRWSARKNKHGGGNAGMSVEASLNQLCGSDGNNTAAARKRVMVVVDHSSDSKHALIWALTHVANKADLLSLLHVVPPHTPSHTSYSTHLLNYLRSICKDCRPEVEVEALVVEGPRLITVTSQVDKLEVSVLVLGQKKPSLLFNWLDFGPASSLLIFSPKLVWKQQRRGVCGTLHPPCRVFDNRSEEAKPRHEWVPNQYKVAEELLASSLELV